MLLRRRFYSASINSKIDTSKDYFNIKSLEDNNSISFTNTIYYSINDSNWNTLLSGQSVTINKNDIIYFKAEIIPVSSSSGGIGTFTISNYCDISGNIMSLLFGDNFEDKIDLKEGDLSTKSYTFYGLFKNCNTIINACNLTLPATTLANYCYGMMFQDCSSLITAPELPATNLTNYCYQYMFDGCISLLKAPKLPATTLATYCYQYMFYNCSSLVTAPELPATNLTNYCYRYMFYNCSSLVTAPKLPATELTTNCYRCMFQGCSNLTKAPELPATDLAGYCYYSMFQGCSNLTKAPELPATNLTSYCYYGMFQGCNGLTTAPELYSRDLANYCYAYMFRGCTGLTKMPELPATQLNAYCYNYMFSGCTNIKQSCVLPAIILANYCYQHMFSSCNQLMQVISMAGNLSATSCLSNWLNGTSGYGYFLKNKDVDLDIWPTGTNGIPQGWYTNNYNPTDTDTTDYSKEYFTIEAISDSVITLKVPEYTNIYSLQYSIDNGDWINFDTTSTKVQLNKKSKLRISAVTDKYSLLSNDPEIPGKVSSIISSSGYYKVYGNILSLIHGDNFINYNELEDANDVKHTHLFGGMFASQTSLISVKNLILPLTKLSHGCYLSMFTGCSNLIDCPKLPATTLADNCYKYMFRNCKSIAQAPELPATQLNSYCYYGMFYSCTSLLVSPKLHAQILTNNCYSYMFYNCSNINKITMLATDTSAVSCLNNWVNGVPSTGTFYKHPNISTDTIGTGSNGIPTGWTVIDYTE